MVTTTFSEKKYLKKDDEKDTDKLADMLLMEKKSSTKDVDKGTDELAYTKQALYTILSNGLDQFQGQYSVSKGWFKLDIGFKKTFLKVVHNYIDKCLNRIPKINTQKCIKRLLYHLINYDQEKYEKNQT